MRWTEESSLTRGVLDRESTLDKGRILFKAFLNGFDDDAKDAIFKGEDCVDCWTSH